MFDDGREEMLYILPERVAHIPLLLHVPMLLTALITTWANILCQWRKIPSRLGFWHFWCRCEYVASLASFHGVGDRPVLLLHCYDGLLNEYQQHFEYLFDFLSGASIVMVIIFQ